MGEEKKKSRTEFLKKFQNTKDTPSDPRDGHVHTAAFDEDGNGMTDLAGTPPHVHKILNFKIMDYYTWDEEVGECISCHPGSLAFAELEAIAEMEIFREGTHNGDEYTAEDLDEIALNFHRLKDEVRPKLKITHSESQKAIAGLASYGDIIDCYTKKDSDGKKRLYASISNVPKEVADWIRDRRFPERSIEIYPSFKLGTKDDSPVFHNVLKAIALLGHEMPAVTGMDPVKLKENYETQKTICIGEICFFCEEEATAFLSAGAAGLSAEMELFAEKNLRGKENSNA